MPNESTADSISKKNFDMNKGISELNLDFGSGGNKDNNDGNNGRGGDGDDSNSGDNDSDYFWEYEQFPGSKLASLYVL